MSMLQAGMLFCVLLLASKRAVLGPQKVFARTSIAMIISGSIFAFGIGAKPEDALAVAGYVLILLGLLVLLFSLMKHFAWMLKQRFSN